MADEPLLSREERLRRVLKLCLIFARNMAYYRAAREGDARIISRDNFWNTVDGNFIDVAILEWCKLFGDSRAHQYWGKVFEQQAAFEGDLMKAIAMESAAFAAEIDVIRTYRDKFVAHLDSERVANIPYLDTMWRAVRACFSHALNVEMTADQRARVDVKDIGAYYDACFDEARRAYPAAIKK